MAPAAGARSLVRLAAWQPGRRRRAGRDPRVNSVPPAGALRHRGGKIRGRVAVGGLCALSADTGNSGWADRRVKRLAGTEREIDWLATGWGRRAAYGRAWLANASPWWVAECTGLPGGGPRRCMRC